MPRMAAGFSLQLAGSTYRIVLPLCSVIPVNSYYITLSFLVIYEACWDF